MSTQNHSDHSLQGTYDVLGFVSYTLSLIEQLLRIGKARMAARFTTTINSFQRYLEDHDVPLPEVDSALMQGYERWMRDSGLCRNTTSFYLRNLRTIYRHAVDEGLVVSTYPFRAVYTGIDKTVKRALPLEVIRKLKDLDLHLYPPLEFARDMFLFSFYTRGMSFIDMAQLTERNLQGGVLTYHRQKTSQLITIKWEAPMQAIVDKYKPADSPYLLPLAPVAGEAFWRKYKNAYKRISTHLQKLGKQLGLSIPLTTYVARHSWASIARSQQVPISTISEALGHDSEKTTQIYLSTLDTSVIDDANSLIINLL